MKSSDVGSTPRGGKASGRRRAFTLVELLVVIAIIALLIAILMPSLRQARAAGKLAACASNLRQIGIAIQAYAGENRGFIPRGPTPTHPFDFAASATATNQLWIGVGMYGPPLGHPYEYTGAGLLLTGICPNPKVFYCPADDACNLQEEEPKIKTDEDAYGSYVYRHLDQLPEGATGLLDALGANVVDGVRVPVEMLAIDTNSLGPGDLHHTNHNAKLANVLFRDGSVRRFENRNDCLALAEAVYADMMRIPEALDQLLVNADYAYQGGRPADAPRIDASGGL